MTAKEYFTWYALSVKSINPNKGTWTDSDGDNTRPLSELFNIIKAKLK